MHLIPYPGWTSTKVPLGGISTRGTHGKNFAKDIQGETFTRGTHGENFTKDIQGETIT